jgi:hypothetical protein
MKIDRHNYEAFLLDKLEGRLSADKQQELENFLLLNPDCAGELTEQEVWILKDEKLPFQGNHLLKKDFPDHNSILGDHNFDMFSIARMEGDLSGDQIEAHQAMVEADEQKAHQWRQWQQVRLVDKALFFTGKDQLKRKKISNGRMMWMSVISAAAAVALLIILFRTAPDLPQRESYNQVSEEEISGQNQHIPFEQEEITQQEEPTQQAEPAQLKELLTVEEPAHFPTLPARTDPSDQQDGNISQPAEAMEPVHLSESSVISELEPQSQIQPKAVALSASLFNRTSMVREADSDEIEPLRIPAVPVHNSGLTLAQLSDLGVQEMIEEYAEEKDFSLWKIASAGIKGFNKLTGSEISLMASRDDEGEISGYQLKSKRFSLTRPFGRED